MTTTSPEARVGAGAWASSSAADEPPRRRLPFDVEPPMRLEPRRRHARESAAQFISTTFVTSFSR
ncbi:MAG: hypothetical protein ACLFU0_04730, partial [Alphaproteobacteria bacterium]